MPGRGHAHQLAAARVVEPGLPRLPLAKGRIAWGLLKKTLGFRYVLNVVPLDATLVKGSHGRPPATPDDGAVLISSLPSGEQERFAPTAIHDLILSRVFDG